jgi:large subunit ribosomal protein L23
MNSTHLSLIPHISEKAYAQSLNSTYVFKVPVSSNKQQIVAAVTAQYGVKVADARIVIAKGKVKRSVKGGKQYSGQRSNTKKAYVTLVEGDSIKIFDKKSEENK